jgi:general secretion pathway protein F
MVFVVPEMVGIFAQTKTDLPPLTVALIATSDFLTNHGWLLAIALVGAIVAVQQLLKRPVYKRMSDGVLLRIPGIRRVIIGMDTARFSSTLSILMASGVPLLDALKIAGAVMNNLGTAHLEPTGSEQGSGRIESQSCVIAGRFFPADDGAHGRIGRDQWRARDNA